MVYFDSKFEKLAKNLLEEWEEWNLSELQGMVLLGQVTDWMQETKERKKSMMAPRPQIWVLRRKTVLLIKICKLQEGWVNDGLP